MGWDNVAMLWDESNDKDKVSWTSKERVEDKGNIIDVYDGHTDGHTYTRIWSDVVSRGTIRESKVQS